MIREGFGLETKMRCIELAGMIPIDRYGETCIEFIEGSLYSSALRIVGFKKFLHCPLRGERVVIQKKEVVLVKPALHRVQTKYSRRRCG